MAESTAALQTVVSVDTIGSNFDTVLAVYTGASVNALTAVASDDQSGGGGSSALTFNATVGTVYRFAVDGASGGTGTVQLHLNLSHMVLEIDQAVPCGLLVNELVSNALKHAFPDGRKGELWVLLDNLADGVGWHLRVSDNGVGLPPDLDLEHITTLGLKLVSDLSRQLGASLSFGSGPGAVFEVLCQPRGE